MEDEQQQWRSWCSPPDDLLGEVSSRLYAGDYNTFRAVCKTWRSVTIGTRQYSPPEATLRNFSESETLLLVPPATGSSKCTIFHPIRNEIYHIPIPELSGAHVHFSNHSWLLLSRDDFSAFFLNPFTRQKIELPKMPARFTLMSFSEPPTSPKCLVVGLISIGSGVVATLTPGQEWTIVQFGHEEVCFFISAPILYKGRCYCLCEDGSVRILDLNDGGNNWIVRPIPFLEEFSKMTSWSEHFILVDNEELVVVSALENWKRFQILRWDDSKMEWQVKCGLQNKMLFVSSRGMSFTESSVVKGTGNKIYIPMLQEGKSVFYSVTTGKYHSFYYTGFASADLTRQLQGIWIRPTATAEDDKSVAVKEFNEYPISRAAVCLYCPRVSKSGPHPWLVCHGERMPNPILSRIRGTHCDTRIIPVEMQNKSISACSYGCLVLKEAVSNVHFILDIATGQRIQLPPIMDCCYDRCFLSASPADANCHIIFVDDREGCIMFCKLGRDEFFKEDCRNMAGNFERVIPTGGKIYGYSSDNDLGIYEIQGSTIRFVKLLDATRVPMFRPPHVMFSREYLIESSGELFFVYAFSLTFFVPERFDFVIYKVDLSNSMLEWEKVEDIGAQAIFLHGDNTGTFASEPTIRKNCIYYLDQDNSVIYVWDLECRSVTVHYPCSGMDGDCTISWVMLLQDATQ